MFGYYIVQNAFSKVVSLFYRRKKNASKQGFEVDMSIFERKIQIIAFATICFTFCAFLMNLPYSFKIILIIIMLIYPNLLSKHPVFH